MSGGTGRNAAASALLDRLAARLMRDLPGPGDPGPVPTIPELGRRYGLDAHDTDTTLRRAMDGLRRQGVVQRIELPGTQVRGWRLTGKPVPEGQRPARPPTERRSRNAGTEHPEHRRGDRYAAPAG